MKDLAIVPPATLPVASTYRDRLEPGIALTYERDDGTVGGGGADFTIRVDATTRLIPKADCERIIAEVEGALRPAGAATIEHDGKRVTVAAHLARLALACYPHRNPATGYGAALASVFAEFPAAIGAAVVAEIRATGLGSLDFLPTVPRVRMACTAERQVVAHKADVARAHMAEADRRAADDERAEAVAAAKARARSENWQSLASAIGRK